MKPFRVLVDIIDVDGDQMCWSSFWLIMKEYKFANTHYIQECHLPDVIPSYFMVEIEFYGDREFNIFKLKYPREHALLMKEKEFYEENESRLIVPKMLKDVFI